MSTYHATIGSSIGETIRILSLLCDFIHDSLESQQGHDEYVAAIRPIIGFIRERSQALLLLIQFGYLWDGEIIVRPIMEASLKILFISFTNEEERKNRIREFWNDLAEINTLKQSSRAQMVLERTGSEGAFAKGLEPLVLLKKEERALRQKWPRQARRKLEQKWSFSELMRDLEEYLRSSFGEGFVRAAAHNYGLSSHLTHADETGLCLVADRAMRPPEEAERLTYAHAARLMSDCISYLGLVTVAVSHVLGKTKSDFDTALQESEALLKHLGENADRFWAHIDAQQT